MTNDYETEPPPPLEYEPLSTRVLKHDIVASLLLLLSAAAALVLANSPWAHGYEAFWEFEFGLDVGGAAVAKPLRHWVNDGLMCLFFFVVGLEIKREVIAGELASVRKAMLPIVAAVGGMLMPALIYAAINHSSPTHMGWGIPMATDIAFAAGCLALLSKRVPPALTIFLVALAIVDDLGSVLVIALFYSDTIHTAPLVIGILLILFSLALSKAGVRKTSAYALIGILLWIAFLNSGVHSTIAGILLAFTIPPNARYETPKFFGRMTTLLGRFREAEDFENPLLVNARQQSLIRSIGAECRHVEAPLQRIEYSLHPFALLVIMPVFAFANSGITLGGAGITGMLTAPVTLGVFFGLVAGKQVGIMLFAWLAVRLGWASLPSGVNWRHLYGVSWLAGVGFTMALFINGLAFSSAAGERSAEYLAQGKLGVLLASFAAGVVGCLILWMAGERAKD